MMTCVVKQISEGEDEQMHNLHSTANIQAEWWEVEASCFMYV